MGFRLSAAAEEDIIGIAEHGVRLFGPVQARQYHDDLFAIFDLIAANPRMARERRELSPPMRIYPFKAHLVAYRIEEDGDILIVRVRHGHEDWACEGSEWSGEHRASAIKPNIANRSSWYLLACTGPKRRPLFGNADNAVFRRARAHAIEGHAKARWEDMARRSVRADARHSGSTGIGAALPRSEPASTVGARSASIAEPAGGQPPPGRRASFSGCSSRIALRRPLSIQAA